MVAIEFGMWRSGRIGGASGSVTVGMADRESGAEKGGPEGGRAPRSAIRKP